MLQGRKGLPNFMPGFAYGPTILNNAYTWFRSNYITLCGRKVSKRKLQPDTTHHVVCIDHRCCATREDEEMKMQ